MFVVAVVLQTLGFVVQDRMGLAAEATGRMVGLPAAMACFGLGMIGAAQAGGFIPGPVAGAGPDQPAPMAPALPSS